MGLLNTKQRIIDAFITEEGRRQIVDGQFKIEHYSFSDNSAVYAKLNLSGNVDPTVNVLAFESVNLPKDQVCFEADDSGMLVGKTNSNVGLAKGYIFIQNSGSKQTTQASGSQFASLASELTENSLQSFKQLGILMSPDVYDQDVSTFKMSDTTVSFDISSENPIRSTELQEVQLDKTNDFLQDKRLSHIPNFSYLPPINKKKVGETTRRLLGNYVNISQEKLTLPNLMAELNTYRLKGQEKKITFLETSRANNLFGQFFEVGTNTIKKLDVIDFGIHPNPNNEQELMHVFFVGKVFITTNQTYSFIHMFTIVME